MTKLEQLIKKFCPNGTKFVKVEDVVKSISSGLNPRQNFKLNDSDASNWYVTVKEITTGYIVFSDKTDKITDDAVKVIQKRSKLEKDDVLLSGIGTIGKVALVDIPTNNWNCSESVILLKPNKSKIIPKFLKYILESERVQRIFLTNARGSTLKGIRHDDLCNLLIPLPPIEIQTEIVRILDKFTSITAELTAELTLRKKQYEFYRDKILTFKREREIMLGEISDMISSMKNVKGKWAEEGNCQFVDYMNAYNNSSIDVNDLPFATVQNLNQETVQQGDILFTSASETPDELAISSVIEQKIQPGIFLDDHLFGVRLKKEYQNKFALNFLKHYFRSNTFRRQIDKIVLGVTRFYFAKPSLLKTKVFMPNLKDQENIGNILDKFEKYTTNIQSGLPAEIALRQKQYEYYRNKLLTFKELRE